VSRTLTGRSPGPAETRSPGALSGPGAGPGPARRSLAAQNPSLSALGPGRPGGALRAGGRAGVIQADTTVPSVAVTVAYARPKVRPRREGPGNSEIIMISATQAGRDSPSQGQ
jgi:hypothetical protein